MASVTIKGVTKSFGKVTVLQEFNQKFEDGEFITLLGPSGCGKTTMLRLIAGFEKPSSGEIYIGDKLVSSENEFLPPEKRGIGMVFQSYAVWPHMNVFDNIAYPLKIQKIAKNEIEERVSQVLKIVHLDQYKDRFPSELSGGQQQRVSIARALINKPGVLLLDEPLSALDAKLRQNLLIELDLIHDEVGITFIFITHDQQEALSISDRIAVMNAGKVLQVGTPAEVYEAPADTFVADFLGENNFFSGKVTGIINEELAKIDLEGIGEIIIEQDKKVQIGDKVTVSLRPEKIRLSKNEITKSKNCINSVAVYVDEYIYSGFQSKYYVHLKNNKDLKFKIFLQHAAFFDDNDEKAIWWDEDAYITWDAFDGYLVEVESEKK